MHTSSKMILLGFPLKVVRPSGSPCEASSGVFPWGPTADIASPGAARGEADANYVSVGKVPQGGPCPGRGMGKRERGLGTRSRRITKKDLFYIINPVWEDLSGWSPAKEWNSWVVYRCNATSIPDNPAFSDSC